MSHFILLQEYTGLSLFGYYIECTGRLLDMEEAVKRDLVTKKQLNNHTDSDYDAKWYEVKPGDTITVEIFEDDHAQRFIFTIPDHDALDLPTSLDDRERTGSRLHKYLKLVCEYDIDNHFWEE